MNQGAVMNIERFSELLDTYGAEPVNWPAAERTAAEALLAVDPQAQRVLHETVTLNRLLDRSVAHEPSPALRRAVAEIPLREPRSVKLPWLVATFVRGALSATLLLGLGGAYGFIDNPSSDGVADTESGAVDGQAEPASELDDLLVLALGDELDEEQTP